MKNTTKVTIYHKGTAWTKTVYEGAFWDDDKQARIAKTGLSNADSLYVSIPLDKAPELTITNGKDYIVKGECNIVIDASTSAKESASIKEILNVGYTITTCSKKDHGSKRMRHWELGGK